jgi:hypothetical protein
MFNKYNLIGSISKPNVFFIVDNELNDYIGVVVATP